MAYRKASELFSANPGVISPAGHGALPPSFPALPDLSWLVFGDSNPGLQDFSFHTFEHSVFESFRFRDGCSRIRFRPGGSAGPDWPELEGTIRLETTRAIQFIATGDLYRFRGDHRAEAFDGSGDGGIPWYHCADYHSFFTVQSAIVRFEGTVPVLEVRLQWWRVLSAAWNLWHPAESVTVRFRHSSGNVVERGEIIATTGEVFSAGEELLGVMEFRWVSPLFRRAVVEIDSEPCVPTPLDNGRGVDWRDVFSEAGWDVQVETGVISTPTPPDGSWSYSELHEVMLKNREKTDPGAAWRYHASMVNRFRDSQGPLGIAFDHESMDVNQVPREGIAVQAGARIPTDEKYGRYAGRRLAECRDLYFLVAVHEIGHAMGLYHNHLGHGAMETVDGMATHREGGLNADGATDADFSAEDIIRLRFLPDIFVRPGGSEWETAGLSEDGNLAVENHRYESPPRILPDREGAFDLEVGTVENEIPVGAPFRLNLTLRARGESAVRVPSRIGLSTPYLTGWVEDPVGRENVFRSLFQSVAIERLVTLKAGETVVDSVTLLRGRQGALFKTSGIHKVWLVLEWFDGERRISVNAMVRVRVAGIGSPAHQAAWRELARSPATLWYLVSGRSPALRSGEVAVRRALDSGELRRHFGYIHARAQAMVFRDALPNWSEVDSLLQDPEMLRVLNIMEQANARRIRETARNRMKG